jgi:hypothetical protein
VANSSGATVIDIQSHPKWIAARRHAQERKEAMHRHPSFVGRQQRATGSEGRFGAVVGRIGRFSEADAPA